MQPGMPTQGPTVPPSYGLYLLGKKQKARADPSDSAAGGGQPDKHNHILSEVRSQLTDLRDLLTSSRASDADGSADSDFRLTDEQLARMAPQERAAFLNRLAAVQKELLAEDLSSSASHGESFEAIGQVSGRGRPPAPAPPRTTRAQPQIARSHGDVVGDSTRFVERSTVSIRKAKVEPDFSLSHRPVDDEHSESSLSESNDVIEANVVLPPKNPPPVIQRSTSTKRTKPTSEPRTIIQRVKPEIEEVPPSPRLAPEPTDDVQDGVYQARLTLQRRPQGSTARPEAVEDDEDYEPVPVHYDRGSIVSSQSGNRQGGGGLGPSTQGTRRSLTGPRREELEESEEPVDIAQVTSMDVVRVPKRAARPVEVQEPELSVTDPMTIPESLVIYKPKGIERLRRPNAASLVTGSTGPDDYVAVHDAPSQRSRRGSSYVEPEEEDDDFAPNSITAVRKEVVQKVSRASDRVLPDEGYGDDGATGDGVQETKLYISLTDTAAKSRLERSEGQPSRSRRSHREGQRIVTTQLAQYETRPKEAMSEESFEEDSSEPEVTISKLVYPKLTPAQQEQLRRAAERKPKKTKPAIPDARACASVDKPDGVVSVPSMPSEALEKKRSVTEVEGRESHTYASVTPYYEFKKKAAELQRQGRREHDEEDYNEEATIIADASNFVSDRYLSMAMHGDPSIIAGGGKRRSSAGLAGLPLHIRSDMTLGDIAKSGRKFVIAKKEAGSSIPTGVPSRTASTAVEDSDSEPQYEDMTILPAGEQFTGLPQPDFDTFNHSIQSLRQSIMRSSAANSMSAMDSNMDDPYRTRDPGRTGLSPSVLAGTTPVRGTWDESPVHQHPPSAASISAIVTQPRMRPSRNHPPAPEPPLPPGFNGLDGTASIEAPVRAPISRADMGGMVMPDRSNTQPRRQEAQDGGTRMRPGGSARRIPGGPGGGSRPTGASRSSKRAYSGDTMRDMLADGSSEKARGLEQTTGQPLQSNFLQSPDALVSGRSLVIRVKDQPISTKPKEEAPDLAVLADLLHKHVHTLTTDVKPVRRKTRLPRPSFSEVSETISTERSEIDLLDAFFGMEKMMHQEPQAYHPSEPVLSTTKDTLTVVLPTFNHPDSMQSGPGPQPLQLHVQEMPTTMEAIERKNSNTRQSPSSSSKSSSPTGHSRSSSLSAPTNHVEHHHTASHISCTIESELEYTPHSAITTSQTLRTAYGLAQRGKPQLSMTSSPSASSSETEVISEPSGPVRRPSQDRPQMIPTIPMLQVLPQEVYDDLKQLLEESSDIPSQRDEDAPPLSILSFIHSGASSMESQRAHPLYSLPQTRVRAKSKPRELFVDTDSAEVVDTLEPKYTTHEIQLRPLSSGPWPPEKRLLVTKGLISRPPVLDGSEPSENDSLHLLRSVERHNSKRDAVDDSSSVFACSRSLTTSPTLRPHHVRPEYSLRRPIEAAPPSPITPKNIPISTEYHLRRRETPQAIPETVANTSYQLVQRQRNTNIDASISTTTNNALGMDAASFQMTSLHAEPIYSLRHPRELKDLSSSQEDWEGPAIEVTGQRSITHSPISLRPMSSPNQDRTRVISARTGLSPIQDRKAIPVWQLVDSGHNGSRNSVVRTSFTPLGTVQHTKALLASSSPRPKLSSTMAVARGEYTLHEVEGSTRGHHLVPRTEYTLNLQSTDVVESQVANSSFQRREVVPIRSYSAGSALERRVTHNIVQARLTMGRITARETQHVAHSHFILNTQPRDNLYPSDVHTRYSPLLTQEIQVRPARREYFLSDRREPKSEHDTITRVTRAFDVISHEEPERNDEITISDQDIDASFATPPEPYSSASTSGDTPVHDVGRATSAYVLKKQERTDDLEHLHATLALERPQGPAAEARAAIPEYRLKGVEEEQHVVQDVVPSYSHIPHVQQSRARPELYLRGSKQAPRESRASEMHEEGSGLEETPLIRLTRLQNTQYLPRTDVIETYAVSEYHMQSRPRSQVPSREYQLRSSVTAVHDTKEPVANVTARKELWLRSDTPELNASVSILYRSAPTPKPEEGEADVLSCMPQYVLPSDASCVVASSTIDARRDLILQAPERMEGVGAREYDVTPKYQLRGQVPVQRAESEYQMLRSSTSKALSPDPVREDKVFINIHPSIQITTRKSNRQSTPSSSRSFSSSSTFLEGMSIEGFLSEPMETDFTTFDSHADRVPSIDLKADHTISAVDLRPKQQLHHTKSAKGLSGSNRQPAGQTHTQIDKVDMLLDVEASQLRTHPEYRISGEPESPSIQELKRTNFKRLVIKQQNSRDEQMAEWADSVPILRGTSEHIVSIKKQVPTVPLRHPVPTVLDEKEDAPLPPSFHQTEIERIPERRPNPVPLDSPRLSDVADFVPLKGKPVSNVLEVKKPPMIRTSTESSNLATPDHFDEHDSITALLEAVNNEITHVSRPIKTALPVVTNSDTTVMIEDSDTTGTVSTALGVPEKAYSQAPKERVTETTGPYRINPLARHEGVLVAQKKFRLTRRPAQKAYAEVQTDGELVRQPRIAARPKAEKAVSHDTTLQEKKLSSEQTIPPAPTRKMSSIGVVTSFPAKKSVVRLPKSSETRNYRISQEFPSDFSTDATGSHSHEGISTLAAVMDDLEKLSRKQSISEALTSDLAVVEVEDPMKTQDVLSSEQSQEQQERAPLLEKLLLLDEQLTEKRNTLSRYAALLTSTDEERFEPLPQRPLDDAPSPKPVSETRADLCANVLEERKIEHKKPMGTKLPPAITLPVMSHDLVSRIRREITERESYRQVCIRQSPTLWACLQPMEYQESTLVECLSYEILDDLLRVVAYECVESMNLVL
ncbi:hypothetical protein GMRT_23264 [Giardia muris]|uniref:Uncharacterized protein n=1 Tax=Giardia muris TaxID=5742 RepID=A0A4Z1SPT1_GIAMU|nr:hypothetical protein GMRT_23264 [Giardia muris]|eukprot:TNJ27670.1 hypothetical protein GMRT_23264 [Giardia muris]